MRLNTAAFVAFILLAVGFGLYSYLDMQNEITALQIAIPKLMTTVEKLEEQNIRLKYRADIFASPENLLKVAQRNEFAHLTYPTHHNIVVVRDLSAAPKTPVQDLKSPHDAKAPSSIAFAAGIRP